MLLDITNNFSRNVNMDPEIGSFTCVTYLMIDFDSLFSDKAFLKLANFELNVEDYVDALQGVVIIESRKDAFRFAEAPSLFFNMPVTLTFKGIKGFEMCVIDDHKKKTYYGSIFKIKRGDMHFRICGDSQFENRFIILDLIGNADAEVLLEFSIGDYVYKDIDFDNRLLNGNSSLSQYHLQRTQSSFFEESLLQYKRIETTRFNFEFIKEYFGFKDIATKDES